MGSNMQRQAVPLHPHRVRRSSAPAWKASSPATPASRVVAKRDGIVESVDADPHRGRAPIDGERRPRSAKPDIYNLVKFQRSNQNTCINQKPIVQPRRHGQGGRRASPTVRRREMGELALGQNVLVAFMPWQGYNFEDSILVSERMVKDDVFTSIHIEEFECVARDTKLGKEEITRDIPNVGEEALKDLDESGIVRIGAEVKPGDILVGKITPKGETQLSPEEKLLRAIFGEKAGDVRDSSLRVPPGVQGIVINARVFARKGTEKDERAKRHRGRGGGAAARTDQRRRDQDHPRLATTARCASCSIGKTTAGKLVDDKGKVLLDEGREARRRRRSTQIPRKYWDEIQLDDDGARSSVEQLAARARGGRSQRSRSCFQRQDRASLTKGDELPPGVIKMVKVYIAIKRKLSGRRQDGRPPRQQGRRLAASCPRRTCRTSRTARRSTSCSTRSACRSA